MADISSPTSLAYENTVVATTSIGGTSTTTSVSSGIKRGRSSGVHGESTFANELAQEFGDDEHTASHSWQRPALPPIDPNETNIAFQWIEIDMYDGEPLKENPRAGYSLPGGRTGTVPVIVLYGVTEAGNSIATHIHGFSPYLYVSPPPGLTEADLPAFKAALEARIPSTVRARSTKLVEAILAVELVPGLQSILGYHHGKTQNMLRIYVAMPSLVTTTKGILESGFSFGGFPSRNYSIFEANVPFVLRFMIDGGITGCNWCEAPAGTYAIRPLSRRRTHAQLEIDIVYDAIISHPPDGIWQKVAPLRILSFDIECCGRKGQFPEPETDPVIQIANVVTAQGSTTSVCRNVFVMDSCSPIVGARVFSFTDEKEMLDAWANFVREADPDIVTGYNVQNFDLPYLLRRSIKLKTDTAQM